MPLTPAGDEGTTTAPQPTTAPTLTPAGTPWAAGLDLAGLIPLLGAGTALPTRSQLTDADLRAESPAAFWAAVGLCVGVSYGPPPSPPAAFPAVLDGGASGELATGRASSVVPVLWFFLLGLCVTAAAVGVIVPGLALVGIIGCIGALIVGAVALSGPGGVGQ